MWLLGSQTWLQSCACLVARLGCWLGYLHVHPCSFSPSIRLDLIIPSTHHAPDCICPKETTLAAEPRMIERRIWELAFFETGSHYVTQEPQSCLEMPLACANDLFQDPLPRGSYSISYCSEPQFLLHLVILVS